ncbi:MAG TPA: hypothetical protein VF526_11940 [Solirubrobacteraceae bacterium]
MAFTIDGRAGGAFFSTELPGVSSFKRVGMTLRVVIDAWPASF